MENKQNVLKDMKVEAGTLFILLSYKPF